MAEYKATGGCLCGGVKFELTKPLAQVHKCHCSMCRKSIGADYGTFGTVPFKHFKLLKDDTLKDYPSSESLIRSFCGVCGCSLFAKTTSKEVKHIFVSLGTLDGDPGLTIQFHMFAASRAPWVKIDDGLPTCDGFELLDFEALKKED